MQTFDGYSLGHLVLSHFGTCMFFYIETSLSISCLVSGLLGFDHPSVLLFYFNLSCMTSSATDTMLLSYRRGDTSTISAYTNRLDMGNARSKYSDGTCKCKYNVYDLTYGRKLWEIPRPDTQKFDKSIMS